MHPYCSIRMGFFFKFVWVCINLQQNSEWRDQLKFEPQNTKEILCYTLTP